MKKTLTPLQYRQAWDIIDMNLKDEVKWFLESNEFFCTEINTIAHLMDGIANTFEEMIKTEKRLKINEILVRRTDFRRGRE